jgi:hypothetical protein
MGETKTTYHKSIVENDESRGFINVYSEHVTANKKEAKIFFNEKEAQSICDLFSNEFHRGILILK